MNTNRATAVEAANARATELRLTNVGIAASADVDAKTVNDFMSGKRWPNRSSRAGIERALQLPPGELERIAGGKEVAMDHSALPVSAPEDAVLLNLPESALEGLSEVERQEVRAAAMSAALRRAREIRQQ